MLNILKNKKKTMKTKLLRKVRKRFSWYLNSEKRPVLIDNYANKIITYQNDDIQNRYGLEFYKEFSNLSYEKQIESIWHYFKYEMLGDYGYHKYKLKSIFKKTKRNYKLITSLNKKYKDE